MPTGRLSSSNVTAIAATIAALAAVAVSVWDNVQQRRFNQLSVIPRLDYTIQKSGSVEGAVALSNEGIGPAEIRSVEIAFCDADDTGAFGSWNQARSRFDAYGLRLTGYSDLKDDDLVGSERSFEWVRFESPDDAPEGDPVQHLIDRLAFRIEYASIYDDTFVLEREGSCLSTSPGP